MRFTPKKLVSYHGVIHLPWNPFEVDKKDVERMKAYGEFDTAEKPTEETPDTETSEEVSKEETVDEPAEEEPADEQPAKKPGRPKKN